MAPERSPKRVKPNYDTETSVPQPSPPNTPRRDTIDVKPPQQEQSTDLSAQHDPSVRITIQPVTTALIFISHGTAGLARHRQ